MTLLDLSTFDRIAACIVPNRVCSGALGADAGAYVRWLVEQPAMMVQLVRLRRAIGIVDTWAQDTCGKPFANCTGEEQQHVLRDLTSLQDPSTRRAIETLVDTAVAGFLCDPRYGGNRNATGWEHVGWKANRADREARAV